MLSGLDVGRNEPSRFSLGQRLQRTVAGHQHVHELATHGLRDPSPGCQGDPIGSLGLLEGPHRLRTDVEATTDVAESEIEHFAQRPKPASRGSNYLSGWHPAIEGRAELPET